MGLWKRYASICTVSNVSMILVINKLKYSEINVSFAMALICMKVGAPIRLTFRVKVSV